MNNAVIVDLDGTICNTENRNHHIPDWVKFNEACAEDSVYPDIVDVVKSLAGNHHIILCTGRSSSVVIKTKKWLEFYDIPFDMLCMRGIDDFRSDVDVKKQLLNEIKKQFNIIAAIDDRDKVVKMFRDNGITCLQPRRGDY